MREKAEKPAKRKLTRAERKQIEAVIRQAKGDGKAHTVQDSIPFQNMFPDGLCRLEGGAFSKTIAFEDVNYRLAGPEDQRSIFESLCDFYNGYDPSIGVQVSLDSRSGGSAADEMFGIRRQGNDLDPIRDEAVDILRMQYKRGNNGYVKTKYVTLTIEAENLPAARALAMQSRHPFLYLLMAGVMIVDGGIGLVKVFLLRFLKIAILKNTRTPLHDHVRLKYKWSDSQVVIRFVILQILLAVIAYLIAA